MNANDVNAIIDNICNKLGTTVEMVVPEYAKYMIASKVISLIIGVVIAFFATALMKMLVTSLKKKITEYREEYDRDDWYDEDWVVLYVIGDIVIIIIGTIAVTHIASGLDIIPWIISPQGAFVAEVMK
jgi:phosphate/sulfate permease